MTIPTVYWSESAGLLRVVGSEVRGPQGVLERVPDDAVLLMPVPAKCPSCGSGRAEVPNFGCTWHIHHDEWFREDLRRERWPGGG